MHCANSVFLWLPRAKLGDRFGLIDCEEDDQEHTGSARARLLFAESPVGAFSVRCSTAGDEAPFLIDVLVADNWSGMLDILRGSGSPDDCDRAVMDSADPVP